MEEISDNGQMRLTALKKATVISLLMVFLHAAVPVSAQEASEQETDAPAESVELQEEEIEALVEKADATARCRR